MIDIELINTPAVTLTPEKVLESLNKIYCKTSYSVVFSETMPKTTLGTYTYSENKITLYYKHFHTDNDLMKTAIHELTHHIDFIKHGRRQKPHTGTFKKILEYAEHLAYQQGILIKNKSSELDHVYNKAIEFGKAIVNFAKTEKEHHKMELLQEKLHKPSKKSLVHFASLYNSFGGDNETNNI